jgi:SulP family sulfate permease
LAAILILAGFQAIKPAAILKVWRTNALSASVFLLTLVSTLFLPVQQAIFLGVVIQFLLVIFESAERMTIMELVPTEDGDFEERPAPSKLPSNRVTMLLPYGSLFFAAARDFEEEAPNAEETKNAAVIVILRGRNKLGSTAMGVFELYAKTLRDNGGRLFLGEVNEILRAQIERTGTLDQIGEESILPAGEQMLASLQHNYKQAQIWLSDMHSKGNDG